MVLWDDACRASGGLDVIRSRLGLAVVVCSVLVAACVPTAPVPAPEFTMGNFDLAGSRSIPVSTGEQLTKANLAQSGFQLKWNAPTDGFVAGAAATSGDRVVVGDITGQVYAFNRVDGTLIWKTCVEAVCPGTVLFSSGVIASPLVDNQRVFIGTLSGSMVALDLATGSILWRNTPQITSPRVTPTGPIPVDGVWSGAIPVGDNIVFAINPNDEFGTGKFGRGAVVAVDAATGSEVWRRPVISDADFATGSTGAGIWNTTPTYSPELGLIFVGTGQDTDPTGGYAGSDSFFAIHASDGSVAWQTQVRTGDTWNSSLPFDPMHPTDMDVGDSPAVFQLNGQYMVAAGDKAGVFWVLDATTGSILNNGGAGLNLFGGQLPGPGYRGGFSLDSGFMTTGGTVRHFGVFADFTASLQNVVDTFPGGVCSANGFCPFTPDSSSLEILKGDGSTVECSFKVQASQLFSPLNLGDLIFVAGAQNATLYAIDAQTCAVVSTFPLPSGPSQGAQLSISNGTIFAGGGYFGSTGLQALGVAGA